MPNASPGSLVTSRPSRVRPTGRLQGRSIGPGADHDHGLADIVDSVEPYGSIMAGDW
jgi:hypothetical protein